MTVAALPSVADYLEDGVTTAFPAPFRFKAATDLIVERIVAGDVITLAIGVDYAVVGGQSDSGGTVTRTAATAGATLRIRRNTARAQPMVYTTGDRFPAVSHEEALDRQMLIAQEQGDDVADLTDRALLLPPGEASINLPIADLRAGAALVFDENGQPVAKPIGSFPAGPTGAADNTYTSRSLLRSSEKTRKTASLVGDDAVADGRFNYETDNAPYTDDDGFTTLVPPGDLVGAWVRQRSGGLTFTQSGTGAVSRTQEDKSGEFVSVLDFQRPSDPNDTLSFQRALETGKRMLIPYGRAIASDGIYRASNVALHSGASIYSDNALTVIRPSAPFLRAIFNANSGSATNFIEGITLSTFTMRGFVVENGFSEHHHLLCLNGVRGAVIDQVSFIGAQGDALYVGSGDVFGDERHNFGWHVRNCRFDGLIRDNRNGISIIDGIDWSIVGSRFQSLSRSNMPGPIDMEPDSQSFHRISDGLIASNSFDGNGGNLGQIGILFPTSVPLPSRITIRDNTFTNYLGVGAEIAIDVKRTILSSDYSMDVLIDGNKGSNGVRPIDIYAAKGVSMLETNSFQDYTGPAFVGFNGTTDTAWNTTFAPVLRRVGIASTRGVLVGKVNGLDFGPTIEESGTDTPTSFPLQFVNVASTAVRISGLRLKKRPNQTVGINLAGATLDTASNRYLNNDLDGLANQFTSSTTSPADLSLMSGWTNAGTTKLYRSTVGFVTVVLNITGGTTSVATQVALLPPEYRPPTAVSQAFVSGTGMSALRFDPNGAVFITPTAAPSAALMGTVTFPTGQ